MAAVLALSRSAPERWTYEDYSTLDDDRRYEIYDGALIPRQPPTPDLDHQREAFGLAVLLRKFVLENRLGEVFISPVDVVLDARNVVQPDLLFVSGERASILQPRGVFGAPDLVVEVISPGSIQRDRQEKRELYARFGVREYWLVDSAAHSVEVLSFLDGQYQVHAFAVGQGQVTSAVLTGLVISLREIF